MIRSRNVIISGAACQFLQRTTTGRSWNFVNFSTNSNFNVRKIVLVRRRNALNRRRSLCIFVQQLKSFQSLFNRLASFDRKKKFVGVKSVDGHDGRNVGGGVERGDNGRKIFQRKIGKSKPRGLVSHQSVGKRKNSVQIFAWKIWSQRLQDFKLLAKRKMMNILGL